MQTTRPSPSSHNKTSEDVVFVLGAGVDRVLGLPLLILFFVISTSSLIGQARL